MIDGGADRGRDRRLVVDLHLSFDVLEKSSDLLDAADATLGDLDLDLAVLI